jgi:hypothetical protein
LVVLRASGDREPRESGTRALSRWNRATVRSSSASAPRRSFPRAPLSA